MRPLRHLLGRPATNTDSPAGEDSALPKRSWNTLSTLQAGPVADIDDRGVIYPRSRPVSVELWFGHGERWIRGGPGDGLRQTRLEGLPIVETRQKLDDGDVITTAWADESGEGQGRVVIELTNETNVSVILAVVVRPHCLVGEGRIELARAAGSLLVVDKLPLIELGREPGAVVTALDDGADGRTLLDQLELSQAQIPSVAELQSSAGDVSIAAIIPLTRGASRQVEVLEGREEATVAAAPLDTVQAGWKAHLRPTPDVDLPGWPKHLPAALMSSLVGSTYVQGRPLGDDKWEPLDDSIRVAALSRVGLDWAAAHVADALLAQVTEGHIGRDSWAPVAVAIGAIARSPEGREVLERHADAVAAVAGYALSKSRTPNLVDPLIDAIASAHGSDAGADAKEIRGSLQNPQDGSVYVRHGFGAAPESLPALEEALSRKEKSTAETIGFQMAASAAMGHEFEPLVPMRSLAGSTWSWPRNGCGDSPHARAALLVGLLSLCVTERSGGEVDVFPGASPRWLGQKVAFSNMVVAAGRLSVALRWHGERAAILWELVDGPNPEATAAPFVLRCSRLDPEFSTSERSGEALLAVPQALIDERDRTAGTGGDSPRSLL